MPDLTFNSYPNSTPTQFPNLARVGVSLYCAREGLWRFFLVTQTVHSAILNTSKLSRLLWFFLRPHHLCDYLELLFTPGSERARATINHNSQLNLQVYLRTLSRLSWWQHLWMFAGTFITSPTILNYSYARKWTGLKRYNFSHILASLWHEVNVSRSYRNNF